MKLLFAVLAIVAGMATALQASAGAGLAQKVGLGAALVVNTVIVLAGSLIFLVARGPHANFFPVGTPWALYIGGACAYSACLGTRSPFRALRVSASLRSASRSSDTDPAGSGGSDGRPVDRYAQHPAHPDGAHWYLPMIGVEPYARGRGLGGALMRHAVARCDEEGLPAYLESTNPRNISLYVRFGFEILGEIREGACPVVTPMLRKPR